MPKTMTVKEAAPYLQISEWLLYDMVRKMQIPHYKIRAKIMFRQESLDEWVAKQEAANVREVVVDEVQVEKPVIKTSLRVFSGRQSKLSGFRN